MYILYASVSLRFGFSILSHTFAYTSPVSPSVNLSFHSPDYRTQTCLTMISFRFIPALRLAIAFALLALSSTAFAKPALPASRGHPDLPPLQPSDQQLSSALPIMFRKVGQTTHTLEFVNMRHVVSFTPVFNQLKRLTKAIETFKASRHGSHGATVQYMNFRLLEIQAYVHVL